MNAPAKNPINGMQDVCRSLVSLAVHTSVTGVLILVAGPIFTVRASGRPIIVLNTVEAATDLLERRSNFACRPYWPMIELLGRHKNVGFQPYGESLKRGRRLLHGSLGATVVMKDWGHLLDEQSVRLLRKFLSSPEAFYSNVQEYARSSFTGNPINTGL